ncbi:hypothetical protein SERLA73DRAFT_71403 [Serpula lacrymans var. lacrymans S7.3]|uniref:Uncharacterized protein n=1 Tax=Serpula lacrymans var. lacrymans (strain S7.3) TaxID=936435 RepID=F8PQL4_SERL3|nr:hypothetical protein SERLA73DRAFT_71403 [Serpula lacrymans var. lacrymans S7.3]
MSPANNVDNKESLGVPKLEPDGSNWSMYKMKSFGFDLNVPSARATPTTGPSQFGACATTCLRTTPYEACLSLLFFQHKTRLEWALADRECVKHLLGTAPKPSSPPSSPGGTAPTLTQVQHETLTAWTKKEFCARNILG